jgi:hypothetical protein
MWHFSFRNTLEYVFGDIGIYEKLPPFYKKTYWRRIYFDSLCLFEKLLLYLHHNLNFMYLKKRSSKLKNDVTIIQQNYS